MKKHPENEAEMNKAPEAGPQAAAPEAPDTARTEAEGQSLPAEEKTASGSAEMPENGEKKAEKDDAAARLAELEKQNAELKDQYLRKAADFDNYRKRMIREKQEAVDFANASLLVDLVQILDDFDRAISAGTAGQGENSSAMAEGVGMIRKQLGSMLETKYGLEYYPATGEAFDPTIHEAIATQSSPEVKEPTVAEEFLKGYKLKGKVIRLAKVMVRMPGESPKQ